MRRVTLGRTRLAVAGAFATQGFVFISLTTRLPDFSDLWSLSEVELSLLLLGLILTPAWAAVPERRSRTFRLTCRTSVRDLPRGAQSVEVWLPLPRSDAGIHGPRGRASEGGRSRHS